MLGGSGLVLEELLRVPTRSRSRVHWTSRGLAETDLLSRSPNTRRNRADDSLVLGAGAYRITARRS